MAYVGFKINKKEEKELEELELLIRTMDPLQKISNRSSVIKEAIRISLFHLKNTYFYNKGLTKPKNPKIELKEKVYITKIQGSDINIDGTRKR